MPSLFKKSQSGDLNAECQIEDRRVPPPVSPARFISKKEVLARVGVSYPTLWAWMVAGQFPRSRELGGKVAFVEAEVEAWIVNRPVRRLKCDR
jgi:predicted DNA-binding transcriptional regulator AlpA